MQRHDLPLDLLVADVGVALIFCGNMKLDKNKVRFFLTLLFGDFFAFQGPQLHDKHNGGLWRWDDHFVRQHKLHRGRGQARLQQSRHLPGFRHSGQHFGLREGDTLPPRLL